MLRAFLLYMSRAGWAQNAMTHWPLARRVARRFVAGETQEEGIEAVRALAAKGITTTVDVLGESVTEEAEALAITEQYFNLLESLRHLGLQACVSLKLTALGLDIREELATANLCRILEAARNLGVLVTVDMEDHPYTQRTLDMVRHVRYEHQFENVQAVIQSYLYRSDRDIEELSGEGFSVRLCKGAYKEPPEIAYPGKKDVDAAFVRQMNVLLDAAAAGRGYPALATHDERIIEQAKAYAAEKNIPRDRFEFQMLYGVRVAMQEALVREGYGMRVYVPYGTHWYPYFTRRLAERPANLWFFVSNFVRR